MTKKQNKQFDTFFLLKFFIISILSGAATSVISLAVLNQRVMAIEENYAKKDVVEIQLQNIQEDVTDIKGIVEKLR